MIDNGIPKGLREIYLNACESINEIEDKQLKSAVLAVKHAFEKDLARMATPGAVTPRQL